jgi:hypothetical protein
VSFPSVDSGFEIFRAWFSNGIVPFVEWLHALLPHFEGIHSFCLAVKLKMGVYNQTSRDICHTNEVIDPSPFVEISY